MFMSAGRRPDALKTAARRSLFTHVTALSFAALLTATAVAVPAPVGAASATGCTNVITPQASLKTAMGALRAGDTLCLRGGEYVQSVSIVPRKGTALAPITMQSYPGERAVIRGLQRFTDPDFWTFRGLSFAWSQGTYDQHMVKITGGTGWIVEQSEFSGAKSFANLLIVGSSTYGPPTDWIVRESVLRDTFGGETNDARSHNLYVNAPNSRNGLIYRNTFANAPKGYNLKLGGSSLGTDGTDGVKVLYNTFVNGHQANVVLGNGANDNVISRNLMVGNDRGWAVRLYDLRGTGNLVSANYWWDASGGKFCSDYDSTVPCSLVVNGTAGGRNPLLDSRFAPLDSTADDYGRFADTATTSTTSTPSAPTSTSSTASGSLATFDNVDHVRYTTAQVTMRTGPSTGYTSLGVLPSDSKLLATKSARDSSGRVWYFAWSYAAHKSVWVAGWYTR